MIFGRGEQREGRAVEPLAVESGIDAQRLPHPAWAGAQQPEVFHAAPRAHALDAGGGRQRADQHTGAMAFLGTQTSDNINVSGSSLFNPN